MEGLAAALRNALALIASGDPVLLHIVALSLAVSLSAVFCATLLGLPATALHSNPEPGQHGIPIHLARC